MVHLSLDSYLETVLNSCPLQKSVFSGFELDENHYFLNYAPHINCEPAPQ